MTEEEEYKIRDLIPENISEENYANFEIDDCENCGEESVYGVNIDVSETGSSTAPSSRQPYRVRECFGCREEEWEELG